MTDPFFNPPVPDGDSIDDHYCGRCRQPYEWCKCPTDENEEENDG